MQDVGSVKLGDASGACLFAMLQDEQVELCAPHRRAHSALPAETPLGHWACFPHTLTRDADVGLSWDNIYDIFEWERTTNT